MIPQSSEPGPRAIDDFLSSLAHDLRSPLGIIDEAVRALSTDLASGMSDDHRLLVILAQRSVLRLLRTADTVGILGALGAGPLSLTKRPSDLVEIVRAAAAGASAIEPRRGVDLDVELPGAPVVVDVDAASMSRAVSEVVINAIRHAWRRVTVRVELASCEVSVVVDDDGQGVAEERRATLFRRFAPTSSRSGLGVGLSITHDVLVGHGGRVALEGSALSGRPGTVGARFVLSLPARDAAILPRREQPRSQTRVLLVDDHVDAAELLGLVLSGRGFEVTIATSVATAIAARAAGSFDALVSDIGLADGSGNELLRHLRADGLARLPAIALSGLGREADLREAREAGFDEHFTKPVNVELLVEALRRVTGAEMARGVLKGVPEGT